jgi:Fur family transcriptional regulator, ferric uptake regulator
VETGYRNESTLNTQMAAVFNSFLRKGERRLTPERMKVLDYIFISDMNFNADDLFLTMRTEKTRISKATIYNTLRLLCESGLIIKSSKGAKNSCIQYTRA